LSLRGQMEFSNRSDITAVVQARLDVLGEAGREWRETNLSPNIGVTYRPIDETAFRVMLGRGFRMPTVAERYVQTIESGVHVVQNQKLTSEQAWHGELGVTQ